MVFLGGGQSHGLPVGAEPWLSGGGGGGGVRAMDFLDSPLETYYIFCMLCCCIISIRH